MLIIKLIRIVHQHKIYLYQNDNLKRQTYLIISMGTVIVHIQKKIIKISIILFKINPLLISLMHIDLLQKN